MFLSTKRIEKKIAKWLVFVVMEIAFFELFIAPQLCFNESQHHQIRQTAVKEVIKNPEIFKDFVTEGIDEYTASLSPNREWAYNTAIQPNANAFDISCYAPNCYNWPNL